MKNKDFSIQTYSVFFCSLRRFTVGLGTHISRASNTLSLIKVSKLTDLLRVLPLKIWKINPILKLKTAYYKSLSKTIGDI